MRRITHKPGAPWQVIDADRARARNLAVGDYLLARFQRAPARSRENRRAAAKPPACHAAPARRAAAAA